MPPDHLRPPDADGSAAPSSAAPSSAAWLPIADDLIRGLHHALNNRQAAIGSITRILAVDGGAAPYFEILSAEVEMLERTLRLLRWLPRSTDRSPEPVLLTDLLPDIIDLHRMRATAIDLEFRLLDVEPDPPPVRVEPVRMAQAILVLLGAASRAAIAAGAPGVDVRVASADGTVSIVVEPSASAAEEPTATAGCLPEEARLVAELVREDGGILDAAGGEGGERSFGFSLRLPSLALLRRAERF